MQDSLIKLERANEHIALFEREIRSLVDPRSYKVVCNTDKNTGNQTWCFKSPTPIVPLRISAIVGDVLFNLRSSLDHIVWQLVLTNHCEPTFNNKFPIFISHEFDIKKGNSLKGISSRAIEIIKECQPKPGHNWELLFLPALNNTDKHRHLNLAIVYIESASAVFDTDPPMNEDIANAFSFNEIKSDAVLFSIPSKYKLRFYIPRFDIGFSEETNININRPVLEILKNMSDQIGRVLSKLAVEVKKE